MKFSSKIIKEAHKLTKEIKAEYPEINYSFQFGISIKYLLSNKEENKMVELKGSEKQIKWGNDIKKNIEDILDGAVNMELEENKKVFRQREATKKLINSIGLETSASKLINLFNSDSYSRDIAAKTFKLKSDMDIIGKEFKLDEKEISQIKSLLQKYYHQNR